MPSDEGSDEKEPELPDDAGSKTRAQDYEVGFGRPPKARQFRKGQSGNPRGRPRGAKNFSSIMQEELQQPVLVRENGKQKSMSKLRAIAKQLVNRAAAGDHRAIRTLIEYDAGEQKRAAGITPPIEMQDEADQAVIAGLLDRLKNDKDGEEAYDETKTEE